MALKHGARVIACEGKSVGSVEQVVAAGPGEQATHFVVVQGLLIKERRRLPVDWVSSVGESEVHLSVTSVMVDELGYAPDEM